MESSSDLVYEGKLIHETSYPQRSSRYQEIEIGGIKVDYYDPKERIIHEVKKSDKIEISHTWQVKYYMYIMRKAGIDVEKAIVEYPKLRKTEDVYLSNIDIENLKEIVMKIADIKEGDCPGITMEPICKKCAYYDFCWCGEDENKEE